MTPDARFQILALDPANRTGWAFDDGTSRVYGTWDLVQRRETHPGARLVRLWDYLEAFIGARGDLTLIAYEDAHFGAKNHEVAALHAELRGVIRLVAANRHIPVLAVKPTTLKKFATGYGKATKAQMVRAAKTMLEVETADDNEADALFILEYAKQADRFVPAKPKRRSRKRSPQGRLFR